MPQLEINIAQARQILCQAWSAQRAADLLCSELEDPTMMAAEQALRVTQLADSAAQQLQLEDFKLLFSQRDRDAFERNLHGVIKIADQKGSLIQKDRGVVIHLIGLNATLLRALNQELDTKSQRTILQKYGRVSLTIIGLGLGLAYSAWLLWPTSSPFFQARQINQSWGTMRLNRAVSGGPLRVGRSDYNEGIGTHAFSAIQLMFKRPYTRFTGACGVDSFPAPQGSIVCQIRVHGLVVFTSEVMHSGDQAQSFDVDVRAVNQVELIVEDAGDGNISDHADWVDLKFR